MSLFQIVFLLNYIFFGMMFVFNESITAYVIFEVWKV